MEVTEKKHMTKVITPQDWKEIEQRLKDFYHQVKLICDGYEVTLMLQRLDQFRNAIAVYVNGKFEGKWLIEDCEERRRFLCPKTKNYYSRKEMATFKKISKKMFNEIQAKNKFVYYEPYWTSFRALKSHLVKNNEQIELVIA